MQVLKVISSTVISRSCSLVGASNANPFTGIFRSFSRINSVLQRRCPQPDNWPALYDEPRPWKKPKKPTRDYFPVANEYKRLIKYGWRVRMLTPGGRRVLQRRILNGKHVLSH